mmetsp:Transcript_35237/g.64012  ORF Transcript_35237/g.64012 Transcript_35237/m.64012 type:complete len:167 (-) Transcript_35237:67-567(-)
MVHLSEVSDAASFAFRMLDVHGYGELSISTLENNIIFRKSAEIDDADELFEAMDLNRDGYISYRAFLSCTLPQDVLEDKNILHVTFKILDTDSDGFITPPDLAEIFGHVEDSEVCKSTISEVTQDGRISFETWETLFPPALTENTLERRDSVGSVESNDEGQPAPT